MECFKHNKESATKAEEQRVGLLRGNHLLEFTMYINKGEDDEMEICCFKKSKFKTFITYVCFFLTCGLLRLIYHWIPHLYLLSTAVRCKISEAETILITEIYNEKHKMYYVKDIKVLKQEDVSNLYRNQNLLNSEMAEEKTPEPTLSVHFENGKFRDMEKLVLFTCKKVTYIWDIQKQQFIKLKGLDNEVASDVLHQNKGLSIHDQFMRRLIYGSNKILVQETSIAALLFLEVLNPFYIFQVFSFILWFADNYYYYAAAIMAMSIFGITMSVIQTRKNQRNLKSTVHSSDVCTIMRKQLPILSTTEQLHNIEEYKTDVISTELLVPGDVLEIPAHGCVMHCDALLLTGNCILNESMLTGESVPVTKTPLPNIPGLIYDPKEHARHTLFCGTNVIQTRYFGTEKVLAVVIRTGFSTAKGNLVRSILYPPPVDFRFEKDSYRFVAVLGLFATVGFIYTLVIKIMKGAHVGDMIVEALDLITIVVPPALPAAMTVGRFYAQARLKQNNIFCISPRSINVSGSINCVCFDKTGTLTEDGLDLLCVVPTTDKNFENPVKQVDNLPFNKLLCGLVSCHSLTIIDKQIVGDPLDLKMFESTKWTMEDHEIADNTKFNMLFPTVLKSPQNSKMDSESELDQIGIVREFPFSSSSQRMGVIVRKLDGQHFEYYCKGSPEMVLNYVNPESVPDDFHDVLESYTQEGYRVIALAHKVLKLSYAKVQKVQREIIEKDLDLLGLIVLENRLKTDTTPCIQMLNDAMIRVIMVTGDNILTALSVAKDCDIITSNQSVITVNADSDHPPKLYYTLTNTKNTKLPHTDFSLLSNSASIESLDTIESQIQTLSNGLNWKDSVVKRPKALYNNYRFAMTGKVWAVVKEFYPDLIERLVTRGTVFARMSPDQKQQLVQELQKLGYFVAMCGDGANDCGALKAAHTGISLSEAESSVASPFTSKNPNITCVLKIIREGRAALVTSFGIFKYMAAYSLCQFISVLILYSVDSNLTDMEFLYIDLAIISIFAFFFGRNEAYSGKLVKETPLSSLISLSPILSLVLQMVLVIVFQIASFEHLKSNDWYVPFNSSMQVSKDDNGCLENYTIFSISSFQYIILAVVFSKGKPYRTSIFANYGFIISAITMTGLSIYLALYPADFLVTSFELVLPDDLTFRLYLLAYASLNFLFAVLIEEFFIEKLVFKKLRFKFHNVDKSRKKYLAIERDLNRDLKWPSLTADYKSAASPLNPVPVCTAEIVVEKENKFDRNHVLHKLYDNSNDSMKLNMHNEGLVSKSVGNTPLHGFNHLNNETGYFSQDDLLFASFKTETSSQSENFQSLSNTNNTSFNLANSHSNIEELPYDGKGFNELSDSPHNRSNYNGLEMNYFDSSNNS